MKSVLWPATSNVPTQAGRVAVVTGANSGIGFETAAALAGAGATTVLACRNDERAVAARAEILGRFPGADVEVQHLDLADLGQVADAAAEVRDRYGAIHLAVNNAGLIVRSRSVTVAGHETTFAVNHLGHFAWTAHLLPALLADGGRVVTVSSLAHKPAALDWDDLMGERRFRPVAAYRRSKLANLLHSFELQRRLSTSSRAGAADTIAVAAHPGVAASSFWENGAGPHFRFVARATDRAIALACNTTAQGAIPIVHAATADTVIPGRCYGPRIAQRWGGPGLVEPSRRALDADAAMRLWKVSEELTGVSPDL